MPADQVFVTGATGYAGRHVVAELARQGAPVIALVRKPAAGDGYRTVVGDLAAPGSFLGEVSGAGAVVHLADARSDARDAALAEIAGTSYLLDAWRRGPFIYASSGTIQPGQPAPIRENMPVRVNTWYGWAKLGNEFQVRTRVDGFQRGPAVILRPGVIIAANERSQDRQVFGLIYQRCQMNNRFLFDSDEGLETYGMSYIGGADFGRAVSDALKINAAGTYNVAAGFCTWRELIDMINRHSGTHASVGVRPLGPAGPGEYWLPQSRRQLSTQAFVAQTGFASLQPLEQLIAEFAQARLATAPTTVPIRGPERGAA
jgi:nucleoside-diphosphate-sugar epimerase